MTASNTDNAGRGAPSVTFRGTACTVVSVMVGNRMRKEKAPRAGLPIVSAFSVGCR
jgi:hypothetical protein